MGAILDAKEFDEIVGTVGTAAGCAPSWVMDASMRAKGVYVCQLQLSITKDRLEDFFEAEADAAVQVYYIYICIYI